MFDTRDSTLRSFWELESIGITREDGCHGTSDILPKFNESVWFEDGHKDSFEKLVSNEYAAKIS